MNGMAERTNDGMLELRRTGPFAPPITVLSGLNTIVVTDSFRKQFGEVAPWLNFKKVILTHVPEYKWEHWDRSQDLPAEELPPMQEIEDLIDGQPHSDKAVREMETLWECQAELLPNSRIERFNERDICHYDVRLTSENAPDREFFGVPTGDVIVSERLKKWLEAHAGEWLVFNRVYLE
jgi:hypothetical protein